jgi:hypothetical protein
MDTCLVCEPLQIWLYHSQFSETLGSPRENPYRPLQKTKVIDLAPVTGQLAARHHPPPQVVAPRLPDREPSATNTSRLTIGTDQWFDNAHCKKAWRQSDWRLRIVYRKLGNA